MIMVIFSQMTDECSKERYPTLNSKKSHCATLCGHVSNSCVLVGKDVKCHLQHCGLIAVCLQILLNATCRLYFIHCFLLSAFTDN